MSITRHHKISYTWKILKTNKKWNKDKKKKEKKSFKQENKNYEELGYGSRLCTQSKELVCWC